MKKSKLLWLDFLAEINAQKRLKKAVLDTQARDDIALFDAKHADIIVKIYASENRLSELALLKVFDLPNAKEILKDYVRSWRNQLPSSAQTKLLAAPDMDDIVRIFITHQDLTQFAELDLLAKPNAKELALVYINNDRRWRKNFLSPVAQLAMLRLPDNLEILEAFARKDFLTDEAELEMFERPNAITLIKVYIKYRELSEVSEMKLFELPELERTKILLEYAKRRKFGPQAEARLFELPNAEELICSIVSKDNLHNENEPLLLNLPDGIELMKTYVEEYLVADETVEAIFNHPQAAEILPTLLSTQKLNLEHEKRLFTLSNAAELLLQYIKHNELYPETQLMLLDLPTTDAVRLLEAYAVKHEFTMPVIQRLTVRGYFH